jgi:ABC-type long-subunit fatty acid transport system fused permease/ATPase subunit
VVGGGFFTMKHNFVNVRDELTKIYAEYDAFAIYRIVYDEIDRFNT